MFDYIVKFDPKQEGSRFCYQAAYALLCDMEAETGREYDVAPNPYAKEKEGVAKEITVWCPDLEGCNWKKALGAEVNFCPEAETVPLDMIAGICLWHITFYGFNPEEMEETFNDMEDNGETSDEPAYMFYLLSEDTKAFPLYQASAEHGFYRAQVALAFCYEYGLGTDVDLEKAKEMFKRAGLSDKAHGKPEEHLAMLEANEGNYREALHWFKEAERKGNRTVKTYIWYLEKLNQNYTRQATC